MQPESSPSFLPALHQRFSSLIWSCLDAELHRSAIFYGERYFAVDQENHDARHLYAIALLAAGQPHSALCLVQVAADVRCSGCLEVKSRCCSALGRHGQARDALEECLKDPGYSPTPSMNSRTAKVFPEEAVLHCKSGSMAMKGNLHDLAGSSFQQALAANPLIWEAFEGLCTLGTVPPVEDLFPHRPPPVKRSAPEEYPPKIIPMATGAGFFTPDAGGGGNLFRQPQPFRMDPPARPRDSLVTNDSFFHFPDNSILDSHIRPSRSQPVIPTVSQPAISRPLSSADETGPVPKKLRSTARQRIGEEAKSTKPTAALDDRLKKARARPALMLANFFSSSGRDSQSKPLPARAVPSLVKSDNPINAAPTRRSTRLLSGTTTKPNHTTKTAYARDRRRQPAHLRTRSTESEMDDDIGQNDVAVPPSPPSVALSPRSEASPAPSSWTAADEQAAQETYELECADQYIYDLVRLFASATRSLALYDSKTCLLELEKLPHVHQRSPWVMAMAGKAHYESTEYAAAERAFQAVRALEPYRLWDMEVYSTLQWHLQRNVGLSFLAQELLSINPRSPQAWIAVGNCFSLQKERAQALTCFRRAAQLDPSCAYAYTLSGHETLDEDLDKAINFFQSALRADPRHYNAWYGLGTCYMKMSKIRMAEYHYRKAADIHPYNAVLVGCVGLAVERRGDRDEALSLYDDAVKLSPENALVRYRRAKILISMRRYALAVKDLEFLRDATPDESNVIFQLAKVYRLMGDELKSAQLLAIARDVSPKSLNKLQKLVDTVKDEDADQEMDEG
ncbi:hypothetical protein JAAARDRAFT_174746 [Jaapia argillacea MUCL 33604]|uniref:Uncharacterized protein n=1 Tax=Jaapia argillacea MUCL 33604 TaxID=933084 RepID=A0A067Q011_9AGAM|nr:hypothetical protein JAAARDRAFT_174746 [Jaapia argillacea MUCL 33604]